MVLTTQSADDDSTHRVAKQGFAGVERFQARDTEPWFGLRAPVTELG